MTMTTWELVYPLGRVVRRVNPDGSYESRILTDREVAAALIVGGGSAQTKAVHKMLQAALDSSDRSRGV